MSGVFVFIIGQIFIEFILKPIRKYKILKSDAAFCLRFYSATFLNCTIDEDAQKEAKKLSARFVAYSQERSFWLLKVTQKKLEICCQKFSKLYYCVRVGNNSETRDRTEEALESVCKIIEILNLRRFEHFKTKEADLNV